MHYSISLRGFHHSFTHTLFLPLTCCPYQNIHPHSCCVFQPSMPSSHPWQEKKRYCCILWRRYPFISPGLMKEVWGLGADIFFTSRNSLATKNPMEFLQWAGTLQPKSGSSSIQPDLECSPGLGHQPPLWATYSSVPSLSSQKVSFFYLIWIYSLLLYSHFLFSYHCRPCWKFCLHLSNLLEVLEGHIRSFQSLLLSRMNHPNSLSLSS